MSSKRKKPPGNYAESTDVPASKKTRLDSPVQTEAPEQRRTLRQRSKVIKSIPTPALSDKVNNNIGKKSPAGFLSEDSSSSDYELSDSEADEEYKPGKKGTKSKFAVSKQSSSSSTSEAEEVIVKPPKQIRTALKQSKTTRHLLNAIANANSTSKALSDSESDCNERNDTKSENEMKFEFKYFDPNATTSQPIPETKQPISDQESSDSEWEVVAGGDGGDSVLAPPAEKKLVIPKGGVDITIEVPGGAKKKRQLQDEMSEVRREINRIRKDNQKQLHKIQIIGLVYHGLYANRLLNSECELQCLVMSVLPKSLSALKPKKCTSMHLDAILSWYRDTYKFDSVLKPDADENRFTVDRLQAGFDSGLFQSREMFVAVFVLILRFLGFDSRLVYSFQPVDIRAANLLKTPTQVNLSAKSKKKSSDVKLKASTPRTPVAKKQNKCKSKPAGKTKPPEKKPTTPKQNGRAVAATSTPSTEKRSSTRQAARKGSASTSKYFEKEDCDSEMEVDSSNSEQEPSDGSGDESKELAGTSKQQCPKKKSNGVRRSAGTSKSVKVGTNFEKELDVWAEVYLDSESKWLGISVATGELLDYLKISELCVKPVHYVIAYDSKDHVKDITQKYVLNWPNSVRLYRADKDWWEKLLRQHRGPKTKRDKDEDKMMADQLQQQPFPTTISEYKNHPCYALRRHLLKFEGIYPPEAPPLGYVRNEPIFARECVKMLHSRETWLKEARTIVIGQEPYKVVKSRPKWNNVLRQVEVGLPLNLYGLWQTQEYDPPTAVGGKVPRSEYGSVELFKPSMLPKGTVHLNVPNLNRVAKKLGIDCAPAMTGWDFNGWSSHPVYEGWVVCTEFKDILLDAAIEEEKISSQREEERREKRVYGNWKRLIRGLLIREKIKLKYCNKQELSRVETEPKTKGKVPPSRKRK